MELIAASSLVAQGQSIARCRVPPTICEQWRLRRVAGFLSTDWPEMFHVAKFSQHTPYIEPCTPFPLLFSSLFLSRLPQSVRTTIRFIILGDTASKINRWMVVIRRLHMLLDQYRPIRPADFASTSVRAGK